MVLQKLKIINWTMSFYIDKEKMCFKKRLKRVKNLGVQILRRLKKWKIQLANYHNDQQKNIYIGTVENIIMVAIVYDICQI